MPPRLTYIQPKRLFRSTVSLHRSSYKKQLARLGEALQRGGILKQKPNLNPESDPKLDEEETEPNSALARCSLKYKSELGESYSAIVQMSREDIDLQANLTKGSQWGSVLPLHFKDRTAAYRSIPHSFDVLTTPWGEIKRIYKTFDELDHDNTFFHKALVQNKAPPSRNRVREQNDFYQRCKQLRRDEQPRSLLTGEQITKALYPYNVMGFDRSAMGFPLRATQAVYENGKPIYPKEFIEDLSESREGPTVYLNKKYVGQVDVEVLKNTINPDYSRPNPTREALLSFGKPIFVADATQYSALAASRQLEDTIEIQIKGLLNYLDSLGTEKTMGEILSSEWNEIFKNLSTGKLGQTLGDTNITEFDKNSFNDFHKDIFLKSGEYFLASKHEELSYSDGPVYKHYMSRFALVPFFGINLVTRRQYHLLYRHLFKIFLVNCEPLIQILIQGRYKLAEDLNLFTRRLYGWIHNVIIRKIMPVALKHRRPLAAGYNLLIYKPLKTSSFSRLYWIRKPQSPLHHKFQTSSRRGRQKLRFLKRLEKLKFR
ncbi:hypothetical protein PUMCH_000249 [Australozyma saopauloensis]|uniref:Uncharacterized protein n=1 Tax=Australozyma saopauloensis TaxID=291208 RepID=A0AAX4H527_9ASCO|nr:hypothetical protein PUMCH_000249 [[Candida] saopauloensis]